MDPTLKLIQDVYMLALVTWREARGEPHEGLIAVAHSIMTRVHHPAWWGNSVLAVVSKKWQYSSMTDPKDAQLTTWPVDGDRIWNDCLAVAMGVYSGNLANPAPDADSYYADSMPIPPKWADPKKFVVKIGHHSFYALNADHER